MQLCSYAIPTRSALIVSLRVEDGFFSSTRARFTFSEYAWLHPQSYSHNKYSRFSHNSLWFAVYDQWSERSECRPTICALTYLLCIRWSKILVCITVIRLLVWNTTRVNACLVSSSCQAAAQLHDCKQAKRHKYSIKTRQKCLLSYLNVIFNFSSLSISRDVFHLLCYLPSFLSILFFLNFFFSPTYYSVSSSSWPERRGVWAVVKAQPIRQHAVSTCVTIETTEVLTWWNF